jgi:predicted ATP-binding protein involved in virulence
MRLKRLRLTDLQRHADLDLEFAPGLTIVRGPNEAGKTTIERAISTASSAR